MIAEDAKATAALGAASRGADDGLVQCGDWTRGLTAHGKLARGVEITSNYQFGDVTRGIFAAPAPASPKSNEAAVSADDGTDVAGLKARLEAAELEAAAAKGEAAATQAELTALRLSGAAVGAQKQGPANAPFV